MKAPEEQNQLLANFIYLTWERPQGLRHLVPLGTPGPAPILERDRLWNSQHSF